MSLGMRQVAAACSYASILVTSQTCNTLGYEAMIHCLLTKGSIQDWLSQSKFFTSNWKVPGDKLVLRANKSTMCGDLPHFRLCTFTKILEREEQ